MPLYRFVQAIFIAHFGAQAAESSALKGAVERIDRGNIETVVRGFRWDLVGGGRLGYVLQPYREAGAIDEFRAAVRELQNKADGSAEDFEVLLGLISEWDGDLEGARQHFSNALPSPGAVLHRARLAFQQEGADAAAAFLQGCKFDDTDFARFAVIADLLCRDWAGRGSLAEAKGFLDILWERFAKPSQRAVLLPCHADIMRSLDSLEGWRDDQLRAVTAGGRDGLLALHLLGELACYGQERAKAFAYWTRATEHAEIDGPLWGALLRLGARIVGEDREASQLLAPFVLRVIGEAELDPGERLDAVLATPRAILGGALFRWSRDCPDDVAVCAGRILDRMPGSSATGMCASTCVPALEGHLAASPDHVEARLLLAELLREQGRDADAAKVFIDIVVRSYSLGDGAARTPWGKVWPHVYGWGTRGRIPEAPSPRAEGAMSAYWRDWAVFRLGQLEGGGELWRRLDAILERFGESAEERSWLAGVAQLDQPYLQTLEQLSMQDLKESDWMLVKRASSYYQNTRKRGFPGNWNDRLFASLKRMVIAKAEVSGDPFGSSGGFLLRQIGAIDVAEREGLEEHFAALLDRGNRRAMRNAANYYIQQRGDYARGMECDPEYGDRSRVHRYTYLRAMYVVGVPFIGDRYGSYAKFVRVTPQAGLIAKMPFHRFGLLNRHGLLFERGRFTSDRTTGRSEIREILSQDGGRPFREAGFAPSVVKRFDLAVRTLDPRVSTQDLVGDVERWLAEAPSDSLRLAQCLLLIALPEPDYERARELLLPLARKRGSIRREALSALQWIGERTGDRDLAEDAIRRLSAMWDLPKAAGRVVWGIVENKVGPAMTELPADLAAKFEGWEQLVVEDRDAAAQLAVEILCQPNLSREAQRLRQMVYSKLSQDLDTARATIAFLERAAVAAPADPAPDLALYELFGRLRAGALQAELSALRGGCADRLRESSPGHIESLEWLLLESIRAADEGDGEIGEILLEMAAHYPRRAVRYFVDLREKPAMSDFSLLRLVDAILRAGKSGLPPERWRESGRTKLYEFHKLMVDEGLGEQLPAMWNIWMREGRCDLVSAPAEAIDFAEFLAEAGMGEMCRRVIGDSIFGVPDEFVDLRLPKSPVVPLENLNLSVPRQSRSSAWGINGFFDLLLAAQKLGALEELARRCEESRFNGERDRRAQLSLLIGLARRPDMEGLAALVCEYLDRQRLDSSSRWLAEIGGIVEILGLAEGVDGSKPTGRDIVFEVAAAALQKYRNDADRGVFRGSAGLESALSVGMSSAYAHGDPRAAGGLARGFAEWQIGNAKRGWGIKEENVLAIVPHLDQPGDVECLRRLVDACIDEATRQRPNRRRIDFETLLLSLASHCDQLGNRGLADTVLAAATRELGKPASSRRGYTDTVGEQAGRDVVLALLGLGEEARAIALLDAFESGARMVPVDAEKLRTELAAIRNAKAGIGVGGAPVAWCVWREGDESPRAGWAFGGVDVGGVNCIYPAPAADGARGRLLLYDRDPESGARAEVVALPLAIGRLGEVPLPVAGHQGSLSLVIHPAGGGEEVELPVPRGVSMRARAHDVGQWGFTAGEAAGRFRVRKLERSEFSDAPALKMECRLPLGQEKAFITGPLFPYDPLIEYRFSALVRAESPLVNRNAVVSPVVQLVDPSGHVERTITTEKLPAVTDGSWHQVAARIPENRRPSRAVYLRLAFELRASASTSFSVGCTALSIAPMNEVGELVAEGLLVDTMNFSDDGSTLIVADKGGRIFFVEGPAQVEFFGKVELLENESLVSLSRFEDLPLVVAHHSVGRAHRLSIVDPEMGGKLSVIDEWEGELGVALSRGGRWLARQRDGKIELCLINPPEIVKRYELPTEPRQKFELSFVNDPPLLRIAPRRGGQGGLRVVDLDGRELEVRRVLRDPTAEDSVAVEGFVQNLPVEWARYLLHPDGRWLYVCDKFGRLRRWDFDSIAHRPQGAE